MATPPQSQVAKTAGRRSREADYATDEAAGLSTIGAHEHAAELHREAARWQRKANNPGRALLHDEQARVHLQIAHRLAGDEDGEQ